MTDGPMIDSIYQFTPKGRMELFREFEKWLRRPVAAAPTPPTDPGLLSGYLIADIERGSSAIYQLPILTYVPLWENAVIHQVGESCGTLESSTVGAGYSRLVLPAGDFLVWYSAWSSIGGQPQIVSAFVSHDEVPYLGASLAYSLTRLQAGTEIRFAKLSGAKTLNTTVDPDGGGDPTTDALATMFVARLGT